MYRSHLSTYQEEWQRRSRRVDSLFLDLPILSPVPEESRELTDNSQIVPHNDGSNESSRSYSPLPPLIIEILPNKHDDPEEYYIKLQKRMKRAYKRLIIENRSLSSGFFDSISNVTSSDLDSINYDDVDDDCKGNAREYFKNGSNSYSFDSNYADWNDDVESIDTTTTTESSKSDAKELGIEDADMSRPDDEETNQSLASTTIIENEELNFEDLLNPDFGQIETSRNIQNIIFKKDLHNTRIDNDEILQESSSNDWNRSHENDFEGIDADESGNATQNELIDVDNEIEKLKDREIIACDENDLNVVKMMTDENEETDLSSEGTDYRQITTTAIVHVDASKHQEDRESTVYEDSVKSVILPTRSVVKTVTRSVDMQVDFDDITRVEDNEDPPLISSNLHVENESTIEEIEQMRSGHPHSSQESILVTHHRDSETHQPPAFIERPAAMTLSPQNGGANGNSEFRISNDMHEVLSYNFNDSQKSGNDNNLNNSRKRKALDRDSKSVQTGEIFTWNDYNGEIMLTGAKVFRLCSCKDHVCR